MIPVEKTDTIVIGAGVVGLAIARELALAGREVVLLECNDAFGMETSSRNSGVIHAGIYYPPGSLKARCCIQGKKLLYDYCEKHHVPFSRCGKLIIAGGDHQRDHLQALQLNARRSGLEDLEWLERQQVHELEPDVRAAAGLMSPSTGVIDVHELMLAFLADLEDAGGSLVTRHRVLGGAVGGTGLLLELESTDRYTIEAATVINAAGHGAAYVANRIAGFPAEHVPAVYPVRGHYFEYSGKLPFSRLVYPLPGKTGLGVHVTIDLAGQGRFGPDTEYCDDVDYHFDESRKPRFTAAIHNWYPGLDETRLRPGFVGVRPGLQAPGEAPADFIVSGPEDHGMDGLVNLFGIDSPGLTACMALARDVVAKTLA